MQLLIGIEIEYLEIMKNGIMEHLKRQEGPQEVLQWSWMWISVNLLLIYFLFSICGCESAQWRDLSPMCAPAV